MYDDWVEMNVPEFFLGSGERHIWKLDGTTIVKWARENLSRYRKVKRTFVGGSSAGAYITAMLAFAPGYLGANDNCTCLRWKGEWMMSKYTADTKFGEVFDEPVFDGWQHMLDFRRDDSDDWLEKLTFAEMEERTNGTWSARKIMEGCNYLYDCVQKEQVFFSYWNEEEMAACPARCLTGLAAFPLAGKSKFAVICPGGGYGAVCALLEGYPLAKKLNQMGYAAFVVGYRVGRVGLQPAPQEDLAAAVRYILGHAEAFRLDTEDYAVIGFSAGAHLAGSFGIQNIGYGKYHLPKPGVMFLGYPVITMGEMAHAGSRENFLGKENADDKGLQEKYSLEKHVTREYPSTFLWQCDGDDLVPCANSQLMAKALETYNVPCCYEVYHYPTHGLCEDVDDYAQKWLERAVEFWENVGRYHNADK